MYIYVYIYIHAPHTHTQSRIQIQDQKSVSNGIAPSGVNGTIPRMGTSRSTNTASHVRVCSPNLAEPARKDMQDVQRHDAKAAKHVDVLRGNVLAGVFGGVAGMMLDLEGKRGRTPDGKRRRAGQRIVQVRD